MTPQHTKLIEATFDQPFNVDRFAYFARELLNGYDPRNNSYSGNTIPKGFEERIASLRRIGRYEDPEGTLIDILVVKLRRAAQLQTARTTQRNIVARHLKTFEKEAALVAYYADDADVWRFSLVWRTETLSFAEVMTFEEDLTPSRRASFLVGKGEPSHTAKRQLLPVLANPIKPTLAALQAAFSVETVTREFFDQYKKLYLDVLEQLEQVVAQDAAVAADFEAHSINTADFTKKLLGQIVFLYFLQKKGWLGVAQGASWGSGPTDFMRKLFDGDYVAYDNFFNDVLEPLFYEALAVEQPNNFYAPLGVQMPFLNGGLFEPMHGYDWRGTSLTLPNRLFSNAEKTAAGDEGSGILNVFGRYNFTVFEEAPLEQEVAVDPEMLGKVFENLLEVKDRKSKGAFYTPREIVHYMCQESLINYLDDVVNRGDVSLGQSAPQQMQLVGTPPPRQTALAATARVERVPRKDIEFLIRQGSLTVQNELAQQQGRQREGLRLPQAVRDHAVALDSALNSLKVCDPAVGSSAFPVGMLHEIVHARIVLHTHLQHQTINENRPTNLAHYFKRHAIENSLYGVDLDAGAAEIAKLRLWLSLVVEEEHYREPLPNLLYKIVQGDSVSGGNSTRTLFNEIDRQRLRRLKQKYFDITTPVRKRQIEAEIKELHDKLMVDGKFDFSVHFGEVWADGRDGFDIVIGNPPYVRHELIREMKSDLKKNFGTVYASTADLYVYFYARGFELLRERGTLAYISSNKFMRAGYGKKLRSFLTHETTLNAVIDFGDLPVFEATAYPTIVIAQRARPTSNVQITALTVDSLDVLEQLALKIKDLAWQMPQSSLLPTGWALVEPDVLALMEKLRKTGQPLEQYADGKFYYGLKTGLNEAFIIDEATRNLLLMKDPHSADIIEPWLRGRDIKRWNVSWASKYLIKIESSANKEHAWSGKPEEEAELIFKRTYPAISEWFNPMRDKLIQRRDQGKYFWELRACAYYDDFDKQKIFYPDIAKRPEFAFDDKGYFGGNTSYFIPTNQKHLTAVLNSTVIHFFYANISATIRGGYFRFFTSYIQTLPIPPLTEQQIEQISTLTEDLLATWPNEQASEIESQLNRIIYDAFQLNEEEIALVEQTVHEPTGTAQKQRIDKATKAIDLLQGRS